MIHPSSKLLRNEDTIVANIKTSIKSNEEIKI